MTTIRITTMITALAIYAGNVSGQASLSTLTATMSGSFTDHAIAAKPVTTGGIFKIHNPTGAVNDTFWIGFCHGTNPPINDMTEDHYDRARIGVDILGGGAGRMFFTTGLHFAQRERMRIDEEGKVGIGALPYTTYQLNVASSPLSANPMPNGIRASINNTNTGGWGIGLSAEALNNMHNIAITAVAAGNPRGNAHNTGIDADASNAQIAKGINAEASGTAASYGGDFIANNATDAYGINATATGISKSYGGMFKADGSSATSVNYGVHATAKSDRPNYGVYAEADYGGANMSDINYGIYTIAKTSNLGFNNTNYGIYATIDGGLNPVPHPSPANGGGSYAGYFKGGPAFNNSNKAAFFNGPVVAAAPGMYAISDKKFKKDIAPISDAMSKIMKLTPATYTLKQDEFPSFNFERGMQYGFIAQELEKVIPEVVQEAVNPAQFDHKGNKIDDAVTFKAVDYVSLIPILTAAIQEQQTEINAKNTKIAELEARIARLENNTPSGIGTNGTNTGAALYQNTPNPFDSYTDIRYLLPQGYTTAKVLVFDMNGRQLRDISLQGTGEGKVQLSAGELAAGMYLYSLIVDGKEIDTKRMILSE